MTVPTVPTAPRRRRLAAGLALLTLPAALTLAGCSSSSNGAGNGSATTGASSTTPAGTMAPATDSSGAVSSPATTGSTSSVPTGSGSVAALGKAMQSALQHVSSAHVTLHGSAAGQSYSGVGDETLRNGRTQALDLTETLPGAGRIEIRVIGRTSWAKLPAPLNTSGKPWVKLSTSSSNPVVREMATVLQQSLATTSLSSFTAFTDAATSATRRGTTTVAGQQVTHWSLQIDVTKLAMSPTAKQALAAGGVSSVPVELYLDAQNRPVEATEKLQLQGRQATSTVTVSRYNAPVTITAPAPSQVGLR